VEFITDGKLFHTYPHLSQYSNRIKNLPGMELELAKQAQVGMCFNARFAKQNNWPL